MQRIKPHYGENVVRHRVICTGTQGDLTLWASKPLVHTPHAPSIHFRTRLYFAIDVVVVGSIFAILSHVTWRSFQVWRLPEIALPSAVLAITFLSKVTVLRNETDRVRRLAKLQFGVIVAYSVLAAYLVLSLTIPDSSSYQLFSPLWFGKSSTQ